MNGETELNQPRSRIKAGPDVRSDLMRGKTNPNQSEINEPADWWAFLVTWWRRLKETTRNWWWEADSLNVKKERHGWSNVEERLDQENIKTPMKILISWAGIPYRLASARVLLKNIYLMTNLCRELYVSSKLDWIFIYEHMYHQVN